MGELGLVGQAGAGAMKSQSILDKRETINQENWQNPAKMTESPRIYDGLGGLLGTINHLELRLESSQVKNYYALRSARAATVDRGT